MIYTTYQDTMEPTASDTFQGLFNGKTKHQIERSIRAHRGALTKILRYINTACNAVTVLPTSKGVREIEILRAKMEEKIEEIEAGYDTLIEMQPDDERKCLEKNVQARSRSTGRTKGETTRSHRSE